jgi:hypothetical protein
METITPARTRISDRFPVASFTVLAPEKRYFEIACATDPSLFHASQTGKRTARNFFTSRARGLIRASRQGLTYMMPPHQLQQFAGAKRLYYALATYGSPRGDDARFSIHPDALERVPSITLSADFTGRTLQRVRPADANAATAAGSGRYGGVGTALRWGGDDALEAAAARPTIANPSVYDDGFDPGLWEREELARTLDTGEGDVVAGDLEDDYDAPDAPDHGYGDDSAMSASYGEGVVFGARYGAGYEDAPAAMAQGAQVRVVFPPGRALEDYDDEDAPRELDEEEEEHHAHHHHRHHHHHHEHEHGHHEHEHSEHENRYASEDGEGGYGEDDDGGEEGHDHRRRHEHEHQEEYADAQQLRRRRFGRAFGYCEELPREPELPVGARGTTRARTRALDAAPPQALSIPTKLHIVEVVAAAESGDPGALAATDLPQYSAINPDTEFHDPANPAYHRHHIGLSFGLIQFTQRSGALGSVLAAYRASDPAEFAQVFGPSADELVRVTTAETPDRRLGAVEGRVLWDPVWTKRFVEAGKRQGCRTAQRRIAVQAFMDPHLRIASWLGLDTERALAMLYDRCVHQGNGGGLAWVVRTAGPIQTQLQREEALRGLGFDHLGAFQATVPYLEQSDGWGPATHAALAQRLRALGASSPVPVPTLPQMLDRLVEAARNTDAFPRLDRLRRTPELSDAPLLVPED